MFMNWGTVQEGWGVFGWEGRGPGTTHTRTLTLPVASKAVVGQDCADNYQDTLPSKHKIRGGRRGGKKRSHKCITPHDSRRT